MCRNCWSSTQLDSLITYVRILSKWSEPHVQNNLVPRLYRVMSECFIALGGVKPMPCDRRQMTLQWTDLTAAPTHQDTLLMVTPSSQHKHETMLACRCSSNYIVPYSERPSIVAWVKGCIHTDCITTLWSQPYLPRFHTKTDHTAGTNF